MALQLGALRAALVDAGAAPDKADAAAAEVAGYERRLNRIETRLSLLTWMVGATIGLSLVLLGGEMAVWAELADLSGQVGQLNAQTAQVLRSLPH